MRALQIRAFESGHAAHDRQRVGGTGAPCDFLKQSVSLVLAEVTRPSSGRVWEHRTDGRRDSGKPAHTYMQVCVFSGPPVPTDLLKPRNDALAARTRDSSVDTKSARSRSPPGMSRPESTYSLPPHPHTYTSPVDRGYTSK